MDFGFSRFLEMFEERFGRIATTVLIGVVGIALLGYSLHIIVDVTREFHKILSSYSWITEEVLGLLVRAIIIVVFTWIFADALYRYYTVPLFRRMEARFAVTQDEITLAEQKMDEIEANIERRAAELANKTASLQTKIDELKEDIREMTKSQQRSNVLKADPTKVKGGETGE
jgi:C4-dicarboxylate-specific signal transduction histidine kinase